ncbi:ribosome maturation factor RimP [Helicobacter sp. MIT 05-5294]|uniref:ribosome maturation factor RimP n=1 Tax=Helicobacter sp. MIT 05-5294 TaxID=1548150 RepID=UPI00051FF2E2|nr:ribosome maturation factor RimP [Helicobacter sp. MIT 05-5294]TLD89150.1 ribosome maturation factor RimP [Helicobacter sp. MIT 05-5294]
MTLTPTLENQIQRLIESFGLELYDIVSVKENDNQILRICITKPKSQGSKDSQTPLSVTLEDCQEVSLALSPLLDVEMPNSEKYFLEVSSPGIERTLKKPTHYQGAIGECVKIKTTDKKEWKGKLLEVGADSIVLEDKNTKQSIPLDSIKKAQTYFEW